MCPKIHSTIQITPLYTKYIGFNESTSDPVEVRPFFSWVLRHILFLVPLFTDVTQALCCQMIFSAGYFNVVLGLCTLLKLTRSNLRLTLLTLDLDRHIRFTV